MAGIQMFHAARCQIAAAATMCCVGCSSLWDPFLMSRCPQGETCGETSPGVPRLNFANAVNYGVGSSPWCVTVADFNGDTKLDLAVLNQTSESVSVLLG